MKNNLKSMSFIFLALLLTVSEAAFASKLKITPIKAGIYLISGDGGNITVFVGEDGTFAIDDNYGKYSQEVHDLIRSVKGDVPKFLVNTHFHGDHTGSNEYFGEKGSTIVAHKNVHKRLAEGSEIKAFSMVTPPASKHALPTLTYADGVEFYINDDKVDLLHVSNAHTDTDSVVYFHNANVLVLGDIMFNGFFPFIDVANGGSLKGVIDALRTSLTFANDSTVVIPGHGPIASKADVERTIDTLNTAYDRLKKLKNEGSDLKAAVAAKPFADIEKDWGGVIFSADQWIGLVWDNL